MTRRIVNNIMKENNKMEKLNDLELEQASGGVLSDPVNGMQGNVVFTPGTVNYAPNQLTPYVVKRGDCLSVIAQRNNTTVGILQNINHIPNPDQIKEGMTIMIPRRFF